MASLVPADLDPRELPLLLRRASADLSSRGLYVASRWILELLLSLPKHSAPAANAFTSSTPRKATDTLMSDIPDELSIIHPPAPSSPMNLTVDDSAFTRPTTSANPFIHITQPEREPLHEADTYNLAKAYFENKEFMRCSVTIAHLKTPKATFLRLYSRFLAGEKQLHEELGAPIGSKDKLRGTNPDLVSILVELKGCKDPFLLYLKGIILSNLGRRLESMECLLQSAKAYPYNWSCWTKLTVLLDRTEELDALEAHLPPSFMSILFHVHAVLEVHAANDHLAGMIQDLRPHFPTSLYLESQLALINYHMRDFEEAEKVFDDIYKIDPFRMDDIDVFSNILYVMEKRGKLSETARRYGALDRARPETCCLIGNYYSLRGDHAKAVGYFKKALRLDRGYLSAWTLMGHEYVEMANTHAAIEAYRRACDVNHKDYRAWYGLGQAYELLDMPAYALNYFQKATALRPYDSRMWIALGGCYGKLKKADDSIKCFKRAQLSAEAHDISILLRLGTAHRDRNEFAEAAKYWKRCVDTGIREELAPIEYTRCYNLLAEFELGELARPASDAQRQIGDLFLAEHYLEEAAKIDGEDRDRAVELKKIATRLRLDETS